MGLYYKCRLLELPANIILRRPTVTNALAYYCTVFIVAEKKFISQVPEQSLFVYESFIVNVIRSVYVKFYINFTHNTRMTVALF